MGSHGAGISCECGQLGFFSSPLLPVNPCTKDTRLCDSVGAMRFHLSPLFSLPSSRFCSTQIGDRDLAGEIQVALDGRKEKDATVAAQPRLKMRLLFVLSLSGLAVASAARERYAALPIIPEGLTPRYFFDRSQPLAKRDGICGDNHHSCKATTPLLLLLMLCA